MSMRIMHCLAVKLRTMFRWMLAASGKTTVITVAIVVVMIDVSVEMFRPMKPRSGSNKHAAAEPLGAIISVWSAVVRRHLVISVRTNGRRPNLYGNLRCRGAVAHRRYHSNGDNQ